MAFLAAVVHDRIPQAVSLCLVVGRYLKQKSTAVFERRAAIQAKARSAQHRELDRQQLALLARRVVTRRVVLGADLAVREGFGLELRGFQRGAVFPSVGEGPFTPASSHG